MNIIGVIPARYESSRFPGKPLAMIYDRPMVWWVYQRAKRAELLDEIYVATDDKRIKNECDKYNIPCIMTSSEHTNGSERLSEVASMIDADIYITIQGDEPLIEPRLINELVNLICCDNSVQCATFKTPYHNPVDVINSTTPKVVTDLEDNVLLITRAAIPYPKESLDFIIYKPLGLYAWRKDMIKCYRDLRIGPLEKAEGIELLRLLENGYKVRIKEVDSNTVAVDTHKDIERVIEFIRTHEDYREIIKED